MRGSILRRLVPAPVDTFATRREPEADRLARITREIAEEAGAEAATVLGLIERRAPGVEASDAAAFILQELRKGGDARARVFAHALKSPGVLAAERELAVEVQRILRPFAGKPFSVERAREMRAEIVKFLRAKLPAPPVDQLVAAAAAAVEYRDDRIVLRVDALLPLLVPQPLNS